MIVKFYTETDLYEGLYDHRMLIFSRILNNLLDITYTQNLSKLLNHAGIMIQANDDIDR